MTRPYLEHLQLQDLIGHAGGDPWAVDDSLRSGSPTQINFLAQAFHQAAGSATAAEETFRTARQHFQEYTREDGEGLEKQAQGGIPLLSGSAMENVRAGAKWGGPAVGVATGLYNVVGAESVHDACAAAWTAAGATSGGIGTDLVVGLLAPEFLPITATGANALGSWTFGYVGGIIGNLACLP